VTFQAREHTAHHLPYDVPLSTVQYDKADGKRIPLPGGPGDPMASFNAIFLRVRYKAAQATSRW